MKQKMFNKISEKVIEDILVADKSILSEILSVKASDLSFLARQKILVSGKLDLLYLYKNSLLLIELKVVPFYKDIISQINNYYDDLTELQKQNKLIISSLQRIIIVTKAKSTDYNLCKENDIKLISYKPEDVLLKYYENFKELSQFLKIQSGDYGMVRLGLMNHTLKLLSDGLNIKDIFQIENKSEKTIRNRISVAILLNLVNKFKKDFFLTELGLQFVNAYENISDRLSQKQIEILSDFIKENPFYSNITYTIFSFIETIFTLSKNNYPVPKDLAREYFVKSVGKISTWKTERAKETASYIFSNYACELEFLVKIDNHFFISPKGIQAILLLQLNRSIKLIKSKK
jgi:hypothetical protein